MQLTKRERVMRTVRFEETDRIPCYDILENDAIIEYYAGEKLTPESGRRVKGLAIGRVLDMTRMPYGPNVPGRYRREDGIVIQQERWTSWIVEHPFHDLPVLIEWVKKEIQRTKSLVRDRSYAETVHQEMRELLGIFAKGDPTGRDDPTVLVLESGVGLTEMYWMASMELFAYLMADMPDLVEAWLEARLQAELRRVAAIADPELMPIALTYDDLAYKAGLLFRRGGSGVCGCRVSSNWLRPGISVIPSVSFTPTGTSGP